MECSLGFALLFGLFTVRLEGHLVNTNPTSNQNSLAPTGKDGKFPIHDHPISHGQFQKDTVISTADGHKENIVNSGTALSKNGQESTQSTGSYSDANINNNEQNNAQVPAEGHAVNNNYNNNQSGLSQSGQVGIALDPALLSIDKGYEGNIVDSGTVSKNVGQHSTQSNGPSSDANTINNELNNAQVPVEDNLVNNDQNIIQNSITQNGQYDAANYTPKQSTDKNNGVNEKGGNTETIVTNNGKSSIQSMGISEGTKQANILDYVQVPVEDHLVGNDQKNNQNSITQNGQYDAAYTPKQSTDKNNGVNEKGGNTETIVTNKEQSSIQSMGISEGTKQANILDYVQVPVEDNLVGNDQNINQNSIVQNGQYDAAYTSKQSTDKNKGVNEKDGNTETIVTNKEQSSIQSIGISESIKQVNILDYVQVPVEGHLPPKDQPSNQNNEQDIIPIYPDQQVAIDLYQQNIAPSKSKSNENKIGNSEKIVNNNDQQSIQVPVKGHLVTKDQPSNQNNEQDIIPIYPDHQAAIDLYKQNIVPSKSKSNENKIEKSEKIVNNNDQQSLQALPTGTSGDKSGEPSYIQGNEKAINQQQSQGQVFSKMTGSSKPKEQKIKKDSGQSIRSSKISIKTIQNSIDSSKGSALNMEPSYRHTNGQGLGQNGLNPQTQNTVQTPWSQQYHIHANGMIHPNNHGNTHGQFTNRGGTEGYNQLNGHMNGQNIRGRNDFAFNQRQRQRGANGPGQINRFRQPFHNNRLIGDPNVFMRVNSHSASNIGTQTGPFNQPWRQLNNDLNNGYAMPIPRINRRRRRRQRIPIGMNRRMRMNRRPRWFNQRFQSANMNGFNRPFNTQPRRQMIERFDGYNALNMNGVHPEGARNSVGQHWCSYGISMRDYWCGGHRNRQCPPGFVCMSNPFIPGSKGYCCANVVAGFDVS